MPKDASKSLRIAQNELNLRADNTFQFFFSIFRHLAADGVHHGHQLFNIVVNSSTLLSTVSGSVINIQHEQLVEFKSTFLPVLKHNPVTLRQKSSIFEATLVHVEG